MRARRKYIEAIHASWVFFSPPSISIIREHLQKLRHTAAPPQPEDVARVDEKTDSSERIHVFEENMYTILTHRKAGTHQGKSEPTDCQKTPPAQPHQGEKSSSSRHASLSRRRNLAECQ